MEINVTKTELCKMFSEKPYYYRTLNNLMITAIMGIFNFSRTEAIKYLRKQRRYQKYVYKLAKRGNKYVSI